MRPSGEAPSGGSCRGSNPNAASTVPGSTRHRPTSSRLPCGIACMSSNSAVASCTLPHLQRTAEMPSAAFRVHTPARMRMTSAASTAAICAGAAAADAGMEPFFFFLLRLLLPVVVVRGTDVVPAAAADQVARRRSCRLGVDAVSGLPGARLRGTPLLLLLIGNCALPLLVVGVGAISWDVLLPPESAAGLLPSPATEIQASGSSRFWYAASKRPWPKKPLGMPSWRAAQGS